MFILFSDLKYHYFAGYSNPVKNIVPGVCMYETVERNHALALDSGSEFGHHPLHADPSRHNNPLAQDMWEGFQLVTSGRPVFVLATISVKGRFLWTGAGPIEVITPQAFKAVDDLMSVRLAPADKLIVSCGGYPNDESLYHAQKAIELCKYGVLDGGEILLIAGCMEGIGPGNAQVNFYEPLKMPLNDIIASLNKTYKMYAHKTYKFAEQILRLKAIHVYSMLEPEVVENVHLHHCSNPQQLVEQWLNEDSNSTINVISEGNKLAVWPDQK